ncbi:MAG: ASKHA domain-containing protein [Eubacteriales bacterium]|nr:ASKHA domain-containing protein [Eubacteriales bacterium]
MEKHELIRSITAVEVMERLHLKPSQPEYLPTRQEVIRLLQQVETVITPAHHFRRLQLMENSLILGDGQLQGAAMLVTLGQGADELAQILYHSEQVYSQFILEIILDLCLFRYSQAIFTTEEAKLREEGLCFTRILEPQRHLNQGQVQYLLKQLVIRDQPIERTENGMFRPAKTMLFAYQLSMASDRSGVDLTDHHCSRCQLQECMFRKELQFQVRWEESGFSKLFTISPNQDLCSALREQGIQVDAPCGGRGICRKCTIRLKSGRLRGEQAAEGAWLACVSFAETDLVIGPSGGRRLEKDMYVEGAKTTGRCRHSVAVRRQEAIQVGIVIDIGSTTVAVNQVDLERGRAIRWQGFANPQRSYGADVLSRIRAAVDGQQQILREQIVKALREAIAQIYYESTEAQQAYMSSERMRLVIGGNSTMIHLLLGYPCDRLGQYPFSGHSFTAVQAPIQDILDGVVIGGNCYIFPAVSAFVGGDITAGLFAEDFGNNAQIRLLLDIGTNGEMVLGRAGHMIGCSTAAGPVFEGGGIRCGMSALPGAIDHVWQENGQIKCRVLGEASPIGICGTGLIDAVVTLRECGLIDETGLLAEPYFTKGYPLAGAVRLYQEDIRQLQMAKAAIGAGILTLMEAYGIEEGELSEVILAGGFGSKLSAENSRLLGLIPLRQTPIRSAGNLVLAGGIRFLKEVMQEELPAWTLMSEQTQLSAQTQRKSVVDIVLPEQIVLQVREMNLALERGFQDRYLEQMNLPLR